MYHRIAKTDLDPWGLSVSSDHFAEQLEVIKQYFHPLSLQDLLKKHRDGKVPNRSVVVTFDDGYADNLYIAKPLLERYDVAATIFLVTEALVEGRNFWWDELEWALLQPERLPASLELKMNGNHSEWNLGDAVRYNMENRWEDRNRRPWDALPGTRLAFFYSVWQRLLRLSKPEQLEALDSICTWARVGADNRRENRALNIDELSALGHGGLVELGTHTVTHPSLPILSIVKQLEEIQDSKVQLEKITGRPVTSFSYPYGDYSVDTTTLVQKSGYYCACTTKFKCILPGTDPFQLPRFQVEDWDGEEFLSRLNRWQTLS
jgi:peptidoglycan/xylan/chitin deacetylase (PgdA/CDA1 family)